MTNYNYKKAILTTFLALPLLTSAIAMGAIPNAYAGLSPQVDPPFITTTLNQGESGQFPTTVDPQAPLGFTVFLASISNEDDCTNSGFFANIQINFLWPSAL